MTVDYLKDLEGQLVRVHWHFHKKMYSISTYEKGKGWRVVRDKKGNQKFAGKIVLRNVSFKVSEAGRKNARKKHIRNVHAWALGELIWAMPIGNEPVVPCGYKISYSPWSEEPKFVVHDSPEYRCGINSCNMLSMGMNIEKKPLMMGM